MYRDDSIALPEEITLQMKSVSILSSAIIYIKCTLRNMCLLP